MTPETLEALFVQREALAERVVALTRESALTPSKHHTLLVGPRGIGKTHVVAIVYHRLRAMEDLRDRLLIAWLREEEWGVTSFLDLLLRIFRALMEEYDDPDLAERVEALYDLPSDAAERAATTLLGVFVRGRTLLLIVENLAAVFAGLGDVGQKRLRACIQENPFWSILATAQSLFNGVSLRTSPFYGFFHIHHLDELDLPDATQLLANIARHQGDEDLGSFIQTPTGRARVRAVHHLAGGNHRVYVIFSQFLTRESLDKLVDPFLRMLDDLTPYYQQRMGRLSPQQRKIVAFLCEIRHAIPVKGIAQRCFITSQTASGQLKTLREIGYVRAIPLGRESYYELREPLMRLCMEVKKHRGEPIRLFVDFLRIWYSPSELQERLALLPPDAALEREYLHHVLQTTEAESQDWQVTTCVRDLSGHVEKGEFARALQVAEELVAIRGQPEDHVLKAGCLGLLGRSEEALSALDKVLEMYPDYALARHMRGIALGSLGRLDEALASLDEAIELRPDFAHTWGARGLAFFQLKRWEEALRSYDTAVDLDPGLSAVWRERALVLGNMGRFTEALSSAEKALELAPDDAGNWDFRGLALSDLGRWQEALDSWDQAIELGADHSIIRFRRAEALVVLNRWDEGIAALDGALQRLADADEPHAGSVHAIPQRLFTGSPDPVLWRERAASLLALYERCHAAEDLAVGLARSISELASPMLSQAAAQAWLAVWQELAGDHPEFSLPLRLLDAAVRYRETQDQRILLELAAEERALLETLLEIEESSTN